MLYFQVAMEEVAIKGEEVEEVIKGDNNKGM